MTIINPTKNKSSFLFIFLIFSVLLAGGSFYIHQYNQMVNLKHYLSNLEEVLTREQVANADLKDQLYKITDPAKLKSAAVENGLFLDNQPNYLEIERWLSDSSH